MLPSLPPVTPQPRTLRAYTFFLCLIRGPPAGVAHVRPACKAAAAAKSSGDAWWCGPLQREQQGTQGHRCVCGGGALLSPGIWTVEVFLNVGVLLALPPPP